MIGIALGDLNDELLADCCLLFIDRIYNNYPVCDVFVFYKNL